MQAKDVMLTEIITAQPDASMDEILQLILDHDVPSIPIVDEKGALKGIITEGDIVYRLQKGEQDFEPGVAYYGRILKFLKEINKKVGKTAGEVMTEKLYTAAENTSLEEIVGIMLEHRIRHVPIVKNGKMIGLVGRRDLVRALASGNASQRDIK